MNHKSINRGKQLRFVREYRGYSQSALCKKIKGLSQANLSKYENGFEGMLKEDKVEELMKFLDWPLRFLDVRMGNIVTSWDI